MKLTLSKEMIISLYNYKETLKQTRSPILNDFLTMFDKDMTGYINESLLKNWDNILLISFFKHDELTVADIYQIVFRNNIQENPIYYTQSLSNRLTMWFRLGILDRRNVISENKRQTFTYSINKHNKNVSETKKSSVIRTFIANNSLIHFEELYTLILNRYDHKHTMDDSDDIYLRKLIKTQIFNICKKDGNKLTVIEKNIWKNENFKQITK